MWERAEWTLKEQARQRNEAFQTLETSGMSLTTPLPMHPNLLLLVSSEGPAPRVFSGCSDKEAKNRSSSNPLSKAIMPELSAGFSGRKRPGTRTSSWVIVSLSVSCDLPSNAVTQPELEHLARPGRGCWDASPSRGPSPSPLRLPGSGSAWGSRLGLPSLYAEPGRSVSGAGRGGSRPGRGGSGYR